MYEDMSDLISSTDDSSDDQVEEEPTEVEGQSDGGEEESGKEEDVTLELLSGHAPLSGRKRRKKGKKRRLDRETRAVLKRQEVQLWSVWLAILPMT